MVLFRAKSTCFEVDFARLLFIPHQPHTAAATLVSGDGMIEEAVAERTTSITRGNLQYNLLRYLVFEKHHIINGHIGDNTLGIHLPFVRQDNAFPDVVILV